MGPRASQTVAFTVYGPVLRADLPGLCNRVCALLARSGARVAVCDVHAIVPDAVVVDALARLQLAARRHGCRVHLRNASAALLQLVDLMGLEDVIQDE